MIVEMSLMNLQLPVKFAVCVQSKYLCRDSRHIKFSSIKLCYIYLSVYFPAPYIISARKFFQAILVVKRECLLAQVIVQSMLTFINTYFVSGVLAFIESPVIDTQT